MRWLTVTHTQRWHANHHPSGTGPVYQGRFKSFPVESDDHLLTVAQYIERNPLRAGMVEHAENGSGAACGGVAKADACSVLKSLATGRWRLQGTGQGGCSYCIPDAGATPGRSVEVFGGACLVRRGQLGEPRRQVIGWESQRLAPPADNPRRLNHDLLRIQLPISFLVPTPFSRVP